MHHEFAVLDDVRCNYANTQDQEIVFDKVHKDDTYFNVYDCCSTTFSFSHYFFYNESLFFFYYYGSYDNNVCLSLIFYYASETDVFFDLTFTVLT